MNNLKGIILAAGRGSRMGEATIDKPKGLVKFRGKELISYSIDNFLLNGIESIVIVIGYKGDMIREWVFNKYPSHTHKFIFVSNEDWDTTNSGGSLRAAFNNGEFNGFVLAESDLYWERQKYDFSITQAFVGQLANRVGSATTADGILTHSSKDDAKYKTINIYSFGSEDSQKAIDLLTEEFNNEYYESAWYGKISFNNTYLKNSQWGEFDKVEEMVDYEKQPLPFESIPLEEQDVNNSFSNSNSDSSLQFISSEHKGNMWYMAKMNVEELIQTEGTSRTILSSMEKSINENNILTKPLMVYVDGDIYWDEEENDLLINSDNLFVMDGHHRLNVFKNNGYKYIYVAITNKKIDTKSINRIVNKDYQEEFMRILNETSGVESYEKTNQIFKDANLSLNRNRDFIDYTIDGGIQMPKIEFDDFFEYIKEFGLAPIKTIYFTPKPNSFPFGWKYK